MIDSDNLLEETRAVLVENKKILENVTHFLLDDILYKVNDIEKLEEKLNIRYDSGFGCAEINTSFVLLGKDFWLERYEYDGSEWWTFRENLLDRRNFFARSMQVMPNFKIRD